VHAGECTKQPSFGRRSLSAIALPPIQAEMGRLPVVLFVACSALALAAGAVAAVPKDPRTGALRQSWAAEQISAVAAAGVMGPDLAAFRADDPITAGELYEALTALGRPAQVPLDETRIVSMRELDARLVRALGLRPAAARIRIAARDAGLSPTPYVGTETIARLLGLRVNHPQSSEELERSPKQRAPRAEAAYSLARVMAITPEQISAVDRLSQTFVIPELTDWQRSILSRAIRFVGLPYVFAGSSEKRQRIWSDAVAAGFVTAPGGFDCSGLVWRVFKLEPFIEAPQLASVLVGRTTYVMSAEVPPLQRVAFDRLEPGDVIFFGDRGPRSKPTEVGHAGIYVGSGWFVHASSNGVTLQTLQGWYLDRFAWARRPLAEAGLSV
jgi:cell wall-associated NlpC family hydrolase